VSFYQTLAWGEGVSMADFITLECPKCNGKLKIAPGTMSLKCEYCGAEHVVRRDAEGAFLEAYARCPKCGRNDRAEKVTAILRSQTHDTDGFTYQKVNYVRKIGDEYRNVSEDVRIPIHTSQVSGLARQLLPPGPPRLPPRPRASTSSCGLVSAILLLITGLFLLLPAVSCGTSAFDTQSSDTAATLLVLGGSGACIALFLVGAAILMFRRVVPKERARNEAKREMLKDQLEAHQAEVDRLTSLHNLAMERWNQLYYCGRDDCVFLPGAGTFAPIGQMTDYLHLSD
jgi:predicted RNA-binding Zn-ribbon protein involved in translation (DUF1610 family)